MDVHGNGVVVPSGTCVIGVARAQGGCAERWAVVDATGIVLAPGGGATLV